MSEKIYKYKTKEYMKNTNSKFNSKYIRTEKNKQLK